MRIVLALLPAALLSVGTLAADRFAVPQPEQQLDRQRDAFREAYAAAELGDWKPAARHAELLDDYVLWPDLRAAWLRATLPAADPREVDSFLARYGALTPARELRYRYALHLARAGRLPAFLDLYRAYYQDLGSARLDCLAVNAEILAGDGSRVADRAQALWLVGYSQPDECDPVFDYLRGAGLLGEPLYRERYALALAARQYSLARYLARSLDADALADAELWLSAQRDPVAFLESAADRPDDAAERERIAAAIERIALTDARAADEHWHRLRDTRAFSSDRRDALARHIALWYARQHEPAALHRLDALPARIADEEVRRWRARAALASRDWDAVSAVVASMPGEQREEEEWRYWQARALREAGDDEAARGLLEKLSRERSYYGFLAADELGLDYAFDHVTITPDETVLQRLSQDPAFIRARELFHTGLESRGRSEWDDALALLGPGDKIQAGLLAHRWGWHSRAIAALAAARQYDDLALRYPLPWPEQFARASANARIPSGWAYGVARSESLFIPDIRSRAGAIGVMQLMPATGRRTAEELNLPYRGLATLTDPATNIALGATYLGKMLARFDENRVVATAAYNAGPSRVAKWLPASGPLDARIWIENIPFNETRDYVRRVLVSEAIFNWRLTGRTWRLSDGLAAIGSARQVADAGAEPAASCDVSNASRNC